MIPLDWQQQTNLQPSRVLSMMDAVQHLVAVVQMTGDTYLDQVC